MKDNLIDEKFLDSEESVSAKMEILDYPNNEVDIKIEAMIEKCEGLWKCKICEKMVHQKNHIKQHAEKHIEGMVYTCEICSKKYPARYNLKQHISDIHSILFTCDICGKSGMNKGAYRAHRQRNHK